jgi:hypothetical protein
VTGEPEHRGQQGQRSGQHQQDRDDRPDREAVHERQVDHEQPEQRDHHRAARERRGTAGRRQRDARRFPGLMPARQFLAVAGHDQQRVVDPDPEADHGHQIGTEVGDRQRVAGGVHDPEPQADTDQRDQQGQAHRHHGSERQQHDHDRGGDAEPLAGPRRGRHDIVGWRAAHRYLQARMGEAERGVDDVQRRRVGQVHLVHIELDDREPGPGVGRQLVPAAGSQRAGHRRHVREGPDGGHQPGNAAGVLAAGQRVR